MEEQAHWLSRDSTPHPSHSPQFLESAGGVSQPLTQQPHAPVSQVIETQVQLPEVTVELQNSGQTLTGCGAEPANAQPGKTQCTEQT